MARQEFHVLFDHVVSSADVGTTKPGEAIYHLAMERLRLGPGDLVFVDDIGAKVATALALGWRSIQFISTAQVIPEIDEAFRPHPPSPKLLVGSGPTSAVCVLRSDRKQTSLHRRH